MRNSNDVGDYMTRGNDDGACSLLSSEPPTAFVARTAERYVTPTDVPLITSPGKTPTNVHKPSRQPFSSQSCDTTATNTSTSPSVVGDRERAGQEQCYRRASKVMRAPLADAQAGNISCVLPGSSTSTTPTSCVCEEMQGWGKYLRASLSVSDLSRESARQVVDRPAAGPSAVAMHGRVLPLFENAVENLFGVITGFQQGIRAPDFKDGDMAARNGHMHIAKNIAARFSRQAIVLASAQGHLEMVAYLHGNRLEGTTVEAMDLAATFGHLEVVRWLHANRTEGCTMGAMDGAARNAHMHVLVFLHNHRSEGATAAAIDSAAANGHLHVVQWLTANMPALACSTAAMDRAASAGHLDVVKFLHEARREGCTAEAMDSAARRGHLEVVKFLDQNRQEGCTTDAIDNAASGGHIELLKYLSSNRHEGCTAYAMSLAAWHGHLDVVKWLHNNRDEGCTTSAMNGAAYNGHLHVVRWLHENRTEVTRLRTAVVGSEHVPLDNALIAPLHCATTSGCTTCAMDVSAMHGHLEVVKWLTANRSEGCSTNAIDWAAKEGNLDVVKWLHHNRAEGCTQAAADWAAGNGHIDVLRFLLSKRRVGHSLRAVDWATKNGHTEIVALLERSRTRS